MDVSLMRSMYTDLDSSVNDLHLDILFTENDVLRQERIPMDIAIALDRILLMVDRVLARFHIFYFRVIESRIYGLLGLLSIDNMFRVIEQYGIVALINLSLMYIEKTPNIYNVFHRSMDRELDVDDDDYELHLDPENFC